MRTAAVLRARAGRFPFRIRRIGFKIYKDSIEVRRPADTAVAGLGTEPTFSRLNVEYAARGDVLKTHSPKTDAKSVGADPVRESSSNSCAAATPSELPNSDGVAFANVLTLLSGSGPAAAPAGRG